MPGFQELIVIAVVALLVFGPDRLPELARNAGRWVARFRSATQRNVDELARMSEVQSLQAELRELRREFDNARPDLQRGGDPRRAAARGGPGNRGPAGARYFTPGGGLDPMVATRPDDQPPPSDPDAT